MIILAPMAGVNNSAFRLMCREQGADVVSTAMIHVNSICAEPKKVIDMTSFLKKEKPISIQLVGYDPEKAGEATRKISPYADYIDINFGCPEKDIIENKSGAYFMKEPTGMYNFAKAIIDNTDKPVTAKIRTGWHKHNVMEYVDILNKLDLKWITIHGRTTKQGYSGKADWSCIKEAVEKSSIPIIGNGDIFKPGTAQAMINYTNCEGVMIGRASIGNPFIFKRTKYLLEKGSNLPETTRKEKLEGFTTWLKYYEEYEENRSFSEIKTQAMWFLKGLSNCKKHKDEIMRAEDIGEIEDIYENIYR